MDIKSLPELPDHLSGLLEPTAGATSKLLSLWDGLNVELQIAMFLRLVESYEYEWGQYPQWGHFPLTVIKKAIESDNAYLRYLAAQKYYQGGRADEEIGEIINNDPDPLVRYCVYEYAADRNPASPIEEIVSALGKAFSGDDEITEEQRSARVERFLSLTQEARLAVFRGLSPKEGGLGPLIADVYAAGVVPGKVAEDDILELLREYVYKLNHSDDEQRKVVDEYYANELAWAHGIPDEDPWCASIRELWELVNQVPEEIATFLIETLPESTRESGGYRDDMGVHYAITDEVVQDMSKEQLIRMLKRDDMPATTFRKQLFFGAAGGLGELASDEDVREAASSYLQLNYWDYAEVLEKPDDERLVDLLLLTNATFRSLSVCIYASIIDELAPLLEAESQKNKFDGDAPKEAERQMQYRLERLSGKQHDDEWFELELYRIAVVWALEPDHGVSDEISFLLPEVISGDVWGTFSKFSEKLRVQPIFQDDVTTYISRYEDRGEFPSVLRYVNAPPEGYQYYEVSDEPERDTEKSGRDSSSLDDGLKEIRKEIKKVSNSLQEHHDKTTSDYHAQMRETKYWIEHESYELKSRLSTHTTVLYAFIAISILALLFFAV